jgi:hypothetical protein
MASPRGQTTLCQRANPCGQGPGYPATASASGRQWDRSALAQLQCGGTAQSAQEGFKAESG